MLTVIGLGSAGCNIAEMFEQVDGINVYLIDKDIEGENCISVEPRKTPEEYEKHFADLSLIKNNISKEVLFILGGSGKISGMSLKILEQIKDREISVLYIKDNSKVNGVEALQQKITFNVLQEYARSGAFKQIVLVTNDMVENMLGDIPIFSYHDTLNNLIYNTYTTINVLSLQDSILENYTEPNETDRICTYGVYDVENDAEKLFFPLDFASQKCYYFGVTEQNLKSDAKLLRNIKDKINSKVSAGTSIYYKIFKTTADKNFCYIKAISKKIQT
jgi:hypothetical protein